MRAFTIRRREQHHLSVRGVIIRQLGKKLGLRDAPSNVMGACLPHQRLIRRDSVLRKPGVAASASLVRVPILIY